MYYGGDFMEDNVIFLSPSAQERNVGVGDYGTEEYRMNRIADIVEDLLRQRGYTVYRNNPNNTLRQIINQSNEIQPSIHVALHSNAGNGNAIGPEIFTNRAGTKADELARDIYDEILNIYYNKEAGRGVKYTTSLAEIRDVNAPSVLLEVAFHDNEADANWIIQNERQIAEAVVKGIDKYFAS